MPPILKFARLTAEDVELAAAVVRYVADRTPTIEEFDRLAELLECCADIYADEQRLYEAELAERS